MSFEPTALPYRLILDRIKCLLTLPVQNHDIYQIKMVLSESNLTMFTSNEYEEEYGLFLYNAT